MSSDEALERAIGDWLLRKENDPALLPGEFARELPEGLRAEFLAELEALAEIDGMATMAPPRDLPRRYGDFRVLGEIGRGAMGAVYDAEQVSTGRRVALKVMHGHIAREAQPQSRFRREARTAASLEHPGIVRVLDFGETDGAWWLAMERIDGCSLQRLLAAAIDPRDVDHERARRLFADPRRLARALADVADALAFAHAHGVVHRDVKPANLMCADDGRMVVLDFGLATAREPDSPTLTRTGDFLGTPLYMAPEQAVGAENGTPSSDVYALGAVLYECLCGQTPVTSGPLATVIDAILNRDPVDPRRRRAAVPDELANIALQCLEKNPRDRYPSADALAADLRRFVAGSGVHARASGLLGRSLRRWRRRPTLAIWPAVAAVLVTVAIVGGVIAARAAEARELLQREQDLRRVDEMLASAPERVTVFGGASLRFYARLGLGEQIGGGASRSPAADAALRLAEDTAARHPRDAEVWRTLAMARIDVGDDDARTAAVVERLIACPDARPGDRMLAAVWTRQRGRIDEAERLRASAVPADALVDYWLGFWHQDEQDHDAAIAAFARALDAKSSPQELPIERRYQALLHRGWCRTCPDIADLDGAQRDLLQASALRPDYGTAKLLLAALRCLEADSPDDLTEPVQSVNAVLRDAEPWLHVLTARVLLALAEGGTVQNGPVAFGAEFSPIAAMPVRAAFANAFAQVALGLLDAVLAKAPDTFEAGYHRMTALALLGRHADAIAAADSLRRSGGPMRTAAIELQCARVHLAAGRTMEAFTAIDRALAADLGSIAARRLEAIAAAHVGDFGRQSRALDAATARLLAMPREVSVFPDAAAMLPELQIQRARLLHAMGRPAEAIELVRGGDFGGPLAGAGSRRIVLQRQALLATWQREAEAPGPALALVVADDRSPLRWLDRSDARVVPVDAAARMAAWRGWLPATAIARDASVESLLQRAGRLVPDEWQKAPIGTLLANLPALLVNPANAATLLATADRLLATEPGHGEARLLRALVLHLGGQSRQAAEFLARTAAGHEGDLRSRYLLAVAADAIGDRDLLRRALVRDSGALTARELDLAAALLPLAPRPAGAALMAAAQ